MIKPLKKLLPFLKKIIEIAAPRSNPRVHLYHLRQIIIEIVFAKILK
jgi:hypothetical protein